MSITTLIGLSIDCHNGQLKKNAGFETVGHPIQGQRTLLVRRPKSMVYWSLYLINHSVYLGFYKC